MEASGAPAKRLEPGRVLAETFRLYRENLGPLLGSGLVVFAIFGLLFALLVESDRVALQALAIPLEFAATALYTGVVVKLVQDVRDGRRDSTIGGLFSAAAPAFFSLTAFTLLYGLGVAAGLLLLVVPGLILATIWSLGPAAIVVERTGPIETFGRSRRLVEGNGWMVFVVLFVAGVIAIVASLAMEALVVAIDQGIAAAYVGTVVASALSAPIAALAVAIMYFELGGRASSGDSGSADPLSPSAAS